MAAPTEKLTKNEMSAQKVVTIAIVSTIVFVAIAGLALKMLIPDIFTNQKVLSATFTARTAIDTKKSDAISLLSDYHNLGKQADTVQQGMPSDVAFPELINVMEHMAGSSGVQLQSVAPNQAVASAPASASGVTTAQSTGFSIQLTGNYAAVTQFIKDTELSLRPMRVNDITLTGSSNSLTATMDLTTYYQSSANINDTTETIK
jgi:Tfp pilus assembly protein PilO